MSSIQTSNVFINFSKINNEYYINIQQKYSTFSEKGSQYVINSDGISVNTEEFATVMFHLRSIEAALLSPEYLETIGKKSDEKSVQVSSNFNKRLHDDSMGKPTELNAPTVPFVAPPKKKMAKKKFKGQHSIVS